MRFLLRVTVALLLLFCVSPAPTVRATRPAWSKIGDGRGDAMIAAYFRDETGKLARRSLADIHTLADWQSRREEARRELFEMLGLDPLPPRTPLAPVITGTLEHEQFVVEKLHFQSRPGLYVTGNLYRPKSLAGKAPAILYVCGHSAVKKDGVSFGNKTAYQEHAAWFASNGYVCLTIDTLQLGEIEGIHHGTYREKMWWWNARGYTPAGVEAWNCIRALDYLQSRSEVDGDRLGVTGRSGGGAYSWWLGALDDRIKVAVPVAGITNLKNHVIDGCVEGHCDCMFPVNTYRWDFAQVAALVAPRPLLISNSDKDSIFPLDGVIEVYEKTRRIYALHKAEDKLGLQISEGPHKDTQELRIAAYHWFNRYLKGDDPSVDEPVLKPLEPEQLKVFNVLPADQQNTTIHETFTPMAAAPEVPTSRDEWDGRRASWMADLKAKCFRGWPDEAPDGVPPLDIEPVFRAAHGGIELSAYDFTSQQHIRLRLYLAHRADLKAADLELVVLNAMDAQGWNEFVATIRVGFEREFAGLELPDANPEGFAQEAKMYDSHKWGMAYVAPRGIGPTAWNADERKRTQIERRFMLLGQTLDGMRVWDVRRAVQALRTVDGVRDVPLWMQGEREMAGIVLYASLFEPKVQRLDLWHINKTHRLGPIFLNVLRYLDVPQAIVMAAERSNVRIYQDDATGWEYPQAVAAKLDWADKRIELRSVKQGK
ncbi:MAG: prolyl oligopeptidase family serine peptidase [Planctomycetaceae bacterium]